MAKTWWESGQWNAICDSCGLKFKAKDLKKRWDGLMVCTRDWEVRHPQELIRPIKDMNKLPWTRPRGADVFIPVGSGPFPGCTGLSIYAQTDYGQTDCARIGNINGGLIEP